MPKLRRCFIGVPIGAVCTATVSRHRLNVRNLLSRRVITQDSGDYVFWGLARTDTDPESVNEAEITADGLPTDLKCTDHSRRLPFEVHDEKDSAVGSLPRKVKASDRDSCSPSSDKVSS